MESYHQFQDLPQIQVADDSPLNTPWSAEYGGHSNNPYPSGTRLVHLYGHEIAIDDTASQDMTNMQRFLHGRERPPFMPGYLHTDLNLSQGRQFERLPPWPSVDEYPRDPSPETIWSASSGSQAPQDELRSVRMLDRFSYETPEAQPRNFLPYPNLDRSDNGIYSPEITVGGGGINPREIQYDHDDEPEQSIEDYDYSYEPEPVYCKMEVDPDHYQDCQDSGMGESMRDAESVQPLSRNEDSSDSDYKPGSPKTRRRRRSSQSSSSSNPRRSNKRANHGRKSSTVSVVSESNKITKKTRPSNGSPKGVNSEANSSNANAARPFPCPLAPYTCQSTFASKNEWKRHVSTQHIRLGFWRCDLCPTTVDSNNPSTVYYNDFNRKDLFTQHLRRMHAAPVHQSARNNKIYPVNEDNLAEHQTRCYQHLRSAPPRSTCLFCGRTFSGPGSWDERMEHVGRHMEKDRKTGGGPIDIKDWQEDAVLKEWLVAEGLIEKDRNGAWKLGDGRPRRLSVYEEEEEDEDDESDANDDDEADVAPRRGIKLEA